MILPDEIICPYPKVQCIDGLCGLGFSLEGMQCYAVLEADLLRWKIIRRIVCTAVLWGEKVSIACLRVTKNYSVVAKIIGYFQELRPD